MFSVVIGFWFVAGSLLFWGEGELRGELPLLQWAAGFVAPPKNKFLLWKELCLYPDFSSLGFLAYANEEFVLLLWKAPFFVFHLWQLQGKSKFDVFFSNSGQDFPVILGELGEAKFEVKVLEKTWVWNLVANNLNKLWT